MANKRIFLVILALFIPMVVALSVLDTGLRNSVTPLGIVSFELCGFSRNCEAALEAWNGHQKNIVMLIQGLDYLFLILYPALIAICIQSLGARAFEWQTINKPAVAVCMAMAAADAIENYALIQIVLNDSVGVYGVVASSFASIKFTFVAAGIFWIIALCIVLAMRKRRTQ